MSPLRLFLVLVFAWGALPATTQVARAGRDEPTAPKKLLIVARKSDHGALRPFVAHKEKWRPTELVALESALREKGADDAEKLKRYLYNRWKKDKIGYVLLVGDAEVMPVRYYTVVDLGQWAQASGGMTHIPSEIISDLEANLRSFWRWRKSSRTWCSLRRSGGVWKWSASLRTARR
jgi:hypothetical protein